MPTWYGWDFVANTIKEKEDEMKPTTIFTEAQVVIADGVVIKNNTGMTDTEVKSAEPWGIPPKGYRLVTDKERKEFDYPESGFGDNSIIKFYHSPIRSWILSEGSCSWGPESAWCHFAVPRLFTFTKPEPKKMTVAQVSAMAGEEVEIVAG